MRFSTLVLRSLWHYRATALATAAGTAVAACVISGSIMAGNSVATTVRRTALARIGSADLAVLAVRPFGGHIVRAMKETQGVAVVAPLLLRSASATNPDTEATVARVQLIGADRAFLSLFRGADKLPALDGRSAIVSKALADDLGIRTGDTALLRVASPTSEPTQSLFARRKLHEVVRPLRVACVAVVPDGPGAFALHSETAQPRNVIVDRAWLAEQIGVGGAHDAALLDVRSDTDTASIERALRAAVQPDDLGLTVSTQDRPTPQVVVRGAGVTLVPAQHEALALLRSAHHAEGQAASIMLASRLQCERSRGQAHYALVASVPDIPVADDGIVLNRWMAHDLMADVGDTVTIEWLEPAPDGSYPSRSAGLRVSRIVPVETARAQTWAVPEFKGVTDTARISDWDPPFPLDLSRITSRDDQYWERYRTTPRAFVSLAMAKRMWGSASGEWATAVRFRTHSPRDLPTARSAIEAAILGSDRIRSEGPSPRHIRREALRAAEGSSDFRALMLGMSVFIVASGIALAAMMLRLSAERRAAQLGMLLAVGFTPMRAALAVAAEGSIAAFIGSVAGGMLGVPFAGALIRALNSWWSGAVARHPIEFAPDLAGFASGATAAFVLGSLAAWMTARRMSTARALRLLAGWRATAMTGGHYSAGGDSDPVASSGIRRRRSLSVLPSGLAVVGAALVLWRGGGTIPEAAATLTGGAALLVAGLGLLSGRLAAALYTAVTSSGRYADLSLRQIAMRNAALRRGQSVLIAGVMAGSAFLLVVVASQVRSGSSLDVRDRSSGAGGFNLIARTAAPLAVGFDTATGRANLGFDPEDDGAFEGVEIVPFLASPGVDASCLNLARPVAPRILGVPESFIKRGGFTVMTAERTANPWSLLNRDVPGSSGASRMVPAFGDAESVRWIMQSGLGRSIARQTPSGAYALRFDGLVAFSIFAGEILVSERHFRAMFPDVRAPSYFLIRTPEGAERTVADALRRNLGEAGMEVRSTREVLTEVLAVQNTYLSAFLLLGGIGIVMGSLGTGVIQLRSAYERRSELAIMTALGFTRRDLAALILLEGAGLALYGAALGTFTALAASGARVAAGEAAVNWTALSAVLIGMVVAGLASCLAAAYRATTGPVLDAIRAE